VHERNYELPVTVRGEPAVWTLTLARPQPDSFALALSDGSGRRWSAGGPDVFDAQLNLRRELEAEGIQLCCNGARRNAWSSGMQRDMGDGFSTYLLRLGEHGRRAESVPTLDSAPASEVTTVAEQLAFHERWLSEAR